MTLCQIKSRRGFTLVEVLVALAIVAITLGAGLRVSGAHINSAQRHGDVLRAQLCAENEFIKMRLQRQFPSTGHQTFECEQAGQNYIGRIETKATPNPSFRKVEAQIWSGSPDSKEAYVVLRLSTIMGRF